MRTPTRLVSLTVAVLALLAAVPTRAVADTAPDPIEGKWRGMVGHPIDRVEIGVEFKRNEKGELRFFLSQSVMNFYGLDLGLVTKEGDAYVVKEHAISLKLNGSEIEGTYLALKAPISLKRSDTLPAEVPIPDLPGPGPKWTAKLGGSITAAAAVRDGVAYVGTTGGIMHAVDLKDGHHLFMFVAGRPIHGAALATADRLFFVCDNGFLFALDRKTGKEVWRYELGDAAVSRPLPHQVFDALGVGEFDFDLYAPRPMLADGVLYVGSGDGSLHAVDAAAGKRVWRFEGKGKVRSDAAVDAGRVYFAAFGGLVFAVDRKTGKEVWRKDTRGDNTSSPVLVGDVLVVGNRNGIIAGLKPSTGENVWRLGLWGSATESSAVPAGDGLFAIGSSDLRRVTLADSKDGRVVWRADIFGVAWPRPAVAGKFIYASALAAVPYEIRHRGSLSALDRATGRMVWRWPAPDCCGYMSGFAADPVVDGKTLVAGTLDGNLYAFPVE